MNLLRFVLPCCFVVIVSLVLNSCKPESPCNEDQTPTHTENLLSGGDKDNIPYRTDGRDTLVFISDAGDTAKLFGQGINSYFTSRSENRNRNPDCPIWDLWTYENIEYSFSSQKGEVNNLKYRYYAKDRGLNNFYYSGFSIIDKSGNEASASLRTINDQVNYKDLISIEGNGYPCFQMVHFENFKYDSTLICYYSIDHGVLRFKYRNGKVWTKSFKE